MTGGAHPIVARYRARTPASRTMMARAARVMPGGNTRSTSHHPPYPVVFAEGAGIYLTDLDGHRYLDLFANGFSLIHGNAFPPLAAAAGEVFCSGTAWSGASVPQIALAELLAARFPRTPVARFTNSGSEAGMLAVAIARRVTGRPVILKFTHAYHGMYPDLEAGLYGRGEIAGATALATFNDLASCEAALARHPGQIAAVVYEPAMVTGRVVPPADGFLPALERLASGTGALTILDDCLMFRLAPGGSAERFGLDPDLIVLGKFLGGGTPMGAVLGRAEIMAPLDPARPGAMFHGGSFNGNVLGATLARITLEHLDAAAIARMDRMTAALCDALAAAARAEGVAADVTRAGSIAGIAFAADSARHEDDPGALGPGALFHLACLNEGLALGPGGVFGLTTAATEADVASAADRFGQALAALAAAPADAGRGRHAPDHPMQSGAPP